MTVEASSAATVAAAQRFQAAMPDMGALLLATQATAAPGELLNLSLNASAVLPEAAVLLAIRIKIFCFNKNINIWVEVYLFHNL